MSDSDTDLLLNNVLTFQNQGTIVSAKGPNINNSNISSLCFSNNVRTSTMNMPWNVERRNYAQSVCYPKSFRYRRERDTSPISFDSASGMRPWNMQNSFYPAGMSSQRYNERSGSPMSSRTIDSNASMRSVKDVAIAFEKGILNESHLKMINDAYKKYTKTHPTHNKYMKTRKRVEKRRKLGKFPKSFRHRSGDEASDSSISSDDCRSIRTSKSTNYKENMSSYRSTKTDISNFRMTLRESNMFKDCTENFRQNSFKGIPSEKETVQKNWQNSASVSQTQKDRFKNSFLLPSQRFKQSNVSVPISENLQRINEDNMLEIRSKVSHQGGKYARRNQETDSEQEEIFADTTVVASININGKRSLENEDTPIERKRIKLTPAKNSPKPKAPQQNQSNAVTVRKCNDFVFARPQPPLKKPTITKQQKPVKSSQSQVKPVPQSKDPKELLTEAAPKKFVEPPIEKVISSSQKAVEKVNSKSVQPFEAVQISSEKNSNQIITHGIPQEIELPTNVTQYSTTDMSMRPSFIKRKLFTQKVDVSEKNSSSDSLQAESPQTNMYSKIQKEKNRARKLVTTQSCLNRDLGDDSNLLDLIHKIVPADRMNVTTMANKTEIQNTNSKPTNVDNWDVTSIITTCNNSTVSDTYTDEEIFAGEVSNRQQQHKIVDKSKNEVKIPKSNGAIGPTKDKPSLKNPTPAFNEPRPSTERYGLAKSDIYQVKSFWTDTESDMELEVTPQNRVFPETIVVSNQVPAKAPLENVSPTDVRKPPHGKLLLNKGKEKMDTKNTNNKKVNSTKELKEGQTNSLFKKLEDTTKIVGKVAVENKPVKHAVVKLAKITIAEKVNNNKKDEKTAPASTKQNQSARQLKDLKKNRCKLLDTSLEKPNKKVIDNDKKATLKKHDTKVNNNDSTLNKNESQHIKVDNSTLRIRAQRKPKVNKCCGESDASHHTSIENNTTVCRSLRTRQIDLSTITDSSKTTVSKKLATKNKRTTKNKNVYKSKGDDKTIQSDVSFTLVNEVPPSDRTLRKRKMCANNNNRQSDISFSLTALNNTISTRSSKRNRELELLQNNSASFFRIGKRSPHTTRKIAGESRAINKSSNMRFNRSRR